MKCFVLEETLLNIKGHCFAEVRKNHSRATVGIRSVPKGGPAGLHSTLLAPA